MFYIFVSAQAEHEGVISHALTEQVCSTEHTWYSAHVLLVIDFSINLLNCNWKKIHPLHRDRIVFPHQKVSLLLFWMLIQASQPSSANSWCAFIGSQLMEARNLKEPFRGSECKCVLPAGRGAANLSLSINHLMKLNISVWALLFQPIPVDSPAVPWMHVSDASRLLDLRSEATHN